MTHTKIHKIFNFKGFLLLFCYFVLFVIEIEARKLDELCNCFNENERKVVIFLKSIRNYDWWCFIVLLSKTLSILFFRATKLCQAKKKSPAGFCRELNWVLYNSYIARHIIFDDADHHHQPTNVGNEAGSNSQHQNVVSHQFIVVSESQESPEDSPHWWTMNDEDEEIEFNFSHRSALFFLHFTTQHRKVADL